MTGKKRVLALLCVLVLTVALLPVHRASANGTVVYQTAVNEKFLDLNTATMPALIGGRFYAPYTVFDRDTTGVNLGVSCSQWKTDSEYTLTIYSLGKLLTFDLRAGTCVNHAGEDMNLRAVLRNGRVYVPLSGVCNFFGLWCNYVSTPYGTLVRITNSQAALSTERFLDAANSLMRDRYNAYLRSIAPPPPVPVGPSVPQVTDPDSQDRRNVQVQLAFRCSELTELDSIMDSLERRGARGAFFFRAEDLTACDRQIRRMVGSGHMVGLRLPEELSGREAEEYLASGRRLLAKIAHLRPCVLMPEGKRTDLQELTEAGWVCWQGNIDGLSGRRTASGLARAVLEAAEGKRRLARITLDDSPVTRSAADRILSGLRDAHYNLRIPLETEL